MKDILTRSSPNIPASSGRDRVGNRARSLLHAEEAKRLAWVDEVLEKPKDKPKS